MELAKYRKLVVQAEKQLDYWVAGAELEFTEELCRVMEEQKISRAELARRIGSSPAYITKVLRGNANFTLASMVKLGSALGVELKVHLAVRGAVTVWKDDLNTDWFSRIEETEREHGSKRQVRRALSSRYLRRRKGWWPSEDRETPVEVSNEPCVQEPAPEVPYGETAPAA